jgi:hypothetical protein
MEDNYLEVVTSPAHTTPILQPVGRVSSRPVRINPEEDTDGSNSCIQKQTNQKVFLPSLFEKFSTEILPRRLFLLGSET